jgi:hypothetical protein
MTTHRFNNYREADGSRRELQSLIDWTARHADYVDPLTDLNWTVEQFKKQYRFDLPFVEPQTVFDFPVNPG